MRSVKERAQRRERSAAKEIGGRSVIGSGALWFDKGDIKTDTFLIEDKFTDADTYTIQLATLKTIEKQASKVHKVPFLRFGFEKYGTNYMMFNINYYNEVLDPYEVTKYRIEVNKKSTIIPHEFFERLELNATGFIICYIIFKEDNTETSFAVMTWGDFKNQQNKFIA